MRLSNIAFDVRRWLLSAILLFAVSFSGLAQEAHNLKFELDKKRKSAMVSGLADSSVTRVVIPETVTFGGVAYSVDSIGDFAFRDCSKLTSVTIPDRVVNIGYMAFASCTGLTSIRLPKGMGWISDGAFCRCTGLTSLTIPEGVGLIGRESFAGCTGLTSIKIPESVETVCNWAFSDCTSQWAFPCPGTF